MDIDVEDGVLYVRQTLQRLGGRLVVGPVKSDDSERVIGLPEPRIAAPRQHRVSQTAERELKGILGHDSSTITKLVHVEVTKQAQRSTAGELFRRLTSGSLTGV